MRRVHAPYDKVYPDRLTRFRARMQPLFSSHNPDKDSAVIAAGSVDIKVVPGNHLSMLQEPRVQVLTEKLRACLDGVQPGADYGKTAAYSMRDNTS